jgi:hypothetical protein
MVQSLQYHHPAFEATVPRPDVDIEVTVPWQGGDIEVIIMAGW